MTIRFHRLGDAKEDPVEMNRRMFLMTTTMAGITASAMLGGQAFAQGSVLEAGQIARLLQMVQDIYPHPGILNLAHYEAIVAAVVQNAEGDADTPNALVEGLEQIDQMAQDLFGVPYAEVDDSDAREGLLRHFQHESFFQGVRWTAYFGIYNNKDIWPLLGYEGSSVEHGGYIDRGFSDITFVPEGPSLEERLAEVQG